MIFQRSLRVNVDEIHDEAITHAQCRRCGLRQKQRRFQIGAEQIIPVCGRDLAIAPRPVGTPESRVHQPHESADDHDDEGEVRR